MILKCSSDVYISLHVWFLIIFDLVAFFLNDLTIRRNGKIASILCDTSHLLIQGRRSKAVYVFRKSEVFSSYLVSTHVSEHWQNWRYFRKFANKRDFSRWRRIAIHLFPHYYSSLNFMKMSFVGHRFQLYKLLHNFETALLVVNMCFQGWTCP